MRPNASRLLPSLAAAALLTAAVAAPAAVAAKDGPRMIKDLKTGPDGLDDGQLHVLGALGSRLLFRANVDAGIGAEVYRTDATKAGTGLMKDIKPGPGSSSASSPFVVRNGIGYFSAEDGTHGDELWRTNGTATGTRMVKDIAPNDRNDLSTYVWGTFRGDVVIQASDGNEAGDHGVELWRSDGTANGTKRMTDVNPGTGDSPFAGVIPLGTRLLFISNDGTTGLELFGTNGTPAGTKLVEEINPSGSILSYPGGGVEKPARFKGSIWFYAIDGDGPGDHGGELWRSDGTPSATKLVKDIAPGPESAFVRWFQPISKTRMVFRADGDGGEEPWVTDGTTAGTRRLKDLFPGSASSQALPLGRLGNVLLMAADGGPGVGRELYRTDGTKAGTRLVKDLWLGAPGSDPRNGVVLNGRLYFAATNAKGRELWVTDGTAAGTKRISDINPGAGDAKVQLLTKVGSRIVFFADDGTHGVEPWTYAP
jgi:ELWxxDGT repeat protein